MAFDSANIWVPRSNSITRIPSISTASPETISMQPDSASVSNPASSNPSQLPLPTTVPNEEPSVRGAIRNVDFREFRYVSDCSKETGDGTDKVIHVTNRK
jgi:hypothetical protein